MRTTARRGDGRRQVSPDLVARLVAAQFPEWAGMPARPVDAPGWDNLSFRLGDGLLVRMPSARRYVPQGAKEHRWLPVLAPRLPVAIPEPMARGRPGEGYPWRWSVYRWLPGETAAQAGVAASPLFARDVAGFVTALHRIDAGKGPVAGAHNFYRGGSLAVYDGETRTALEGLKGVIDTNAAGQVWADALSSTWDRPPVWLHGDLAPSNLLVQDGRLCAVIDFGCLGVGDPACDLALAWSFFEPTARAAFRAALTLDPEIWARGRGWALWKALITLAGRPADPSAAHRTLAAVLDDHRREAV